MFPNEKEGPLTVPPDPPQKIFTPKTPLTSLCPTRSVLLPKSKLRGPFWSVWIMARVGFRRCALALAVSVSGQVAALHKVWIPGVFRFVASPLDRGFLTLPPPPDELCLVGFGVQALAVL